MPEQLRVGVLGPVRAWLGGPGGEREIDLGAARQRAVFAVLAAHAGRLVGRDELITAIWGDSPPATAAGSVYTYVSGLRRALTPGLLTTASGGYLLRVDPDDLDSERFQRLRTTAAEMITSGKDREAAAALAEALALWRGDAYATLAGPFLELDRQRLAELRLAAAEQRARILLDSGGDDGLIAELTGLVKDNPLHEPLHELLMRALHRAGRHAEALEVFRAARRTLVDRAGHRARAGAARRCSGRCWPARRSDRPRRNRCARSCRRRSRRRCGTASRRATRSAGTAEIDHLRDLVRQVAAGAGGAVWIEGEPGIGKTELLTHAFGDAARVRLPGGLGRGRSARARAYRCRCCPGPWGWRRRRGGRAARWPSRTWPRTRSSPRCGRPARRRR